MLQLWHMGQTLTIRLTDELREWLEQTSQKTGVPVGRLVREELEKARERGGQRFLRKAGAIDGPRDLSSRKGFSKA